MPPGSSSPCQFTPPFRPASAPHPTACFWEFQQENVAAVFSGWLHTPASGAYAFTLESDDGSRLLLDGSLVVDNGGEVLQGLLHFCWCNFGSAVH